MAQSDPLEIASFQACTRHFPALLPSLSIFIIFSPFLKTIINRCYISKTTKADKAAIEDATDVGTMVLSWPEFEFATLVKSDEPIEDVVSKKESYEND
ncbi:hypothetical protein L1987_33922 [Smallanthus sonchifolius]|uniref:Uncharacterized protein n=1 Tax=Smallanthus sonchifolius TaxID=185202 RepID=A0ACB9HS71_9ASTR|nr:hypothetical protein L1987_33922 [Smallanthus sonchifolius]